MMNADLAICFTANKKYLPHFAVACSSFLRHNPGSWNIFLLSDDVDEKSSTPLHKMIGKLSPTSALHVIDPGKENFTHLKGHHNRLGVQTYFRLLLPDILPQNYTRAFYMDSDVVVNEKLDTLDIEMHHKPIAGALDPLHGKANVKRGLYKYFNAGVVVLNIAMWRKEGYSNKLMSHKTKMMRFADQELLNDYFDGQWAEFTTRNNYPAFMLEGTFKPVMKNGEKPALIHFIGMWKPWKYWYKGSWIYWKAIMKTPYWYKVLLIPETILNSILYKIQRAKK